MTLPSSTIRIKYGIMLTGILLWSAPGSAQEETYPIRSADFDTVKMLHEKQPYIRTEDTSRIHRLLDLANDLRQRSTDSAMATFRDILRQSFLIGYTDGIAMGWMGLGVCHTDIGHYAQAVRLLRQALPYCKQAIFRKTELLGLYYNNMAIPYSHQGKYEAAMSCYYLALQLLQDSRDTNAASSKKLPLLYNNIGATWLGNHQYDKALHYLVEGEKSALMAKRYDLLSSIYLNISAAYGRQKLWDSYDSYVRQAWTWSLKTDDAEMQKRVLTSLGTSYVDRGMAEKAIPYFEKAIISGRNDPYYSQLLPFINIGGALFQLKRYDEAEQYLLRALDLANRLDIRDDHLCDIYAALSDVYAGKNQHRQALTYHQAYARLNDSLLRVERQKMVNQLDVRYKTSEKDKTIAQNSLLIARQHHIIQTNKIWLISIAGGALLSTLFFLILYWNRKRLQAEKIRNLQQEQELSQLKAQIKGEEKERARLARELHDGIVSQLSAISMSFSAIPESHAPLANMVEFRKTLKQLDDATRELRKTAHNLMPEIIIQEGLIEAVRRFCIKMSSTSGIQIDFYLSGSLPALDPDLELSIYRMVQEMIQNILKHTSAIQALVQINCHDPVFILTVEDNGKGISPEVFENANGMGIQNIKARARTFKGIVRLERTGETGTSISVEFDITHFKKKTAPYAYQSSHH